MTNAELEGWEIACYHRNGDYEGKNALANKIAEAIKRAEQRGYKGGWSDSTNRHEVLDDRHFYRKGLLRFKNEVCEKCQEKLKTLLND